MLMSELGAEPTVELQVSVGTKVAFANQRRALTTTTNTQEITM